MATSRLGYIDSLRGFAIVSVIIGHAAIISDTGGVLGKIANLGGYGVQLFFVVSAFTIFLTYSRARETEHHPVRNFFVRRLFRIVPVYWVGIVLYTAVYGLGSRGWLEGPRPWHYPFHVLLINDLNPATQSSVVPGGWSISCEVLFYLTVPLWFYLVKNRRDAFGFLAISLTVLPVAVFGIAHFWSPYLSAYDAATLERFWYRNPLNQMACFACGILLFFLVQDPRLKRYLRRTTMNLTLLGVSVALFVVSTVVHLPLPRFHHLYAIGFMGIALALSAIPWRIAVNRVTEFIGRISYSAYLMHFLVLKQLTIFVPKPLGPGAFYFLFITVAGIVLTIPLAWMSYLLIEKQATRAANRIIARSEVAAAGA